MLSLWMVVSEALAQDCTRIPLDEVTLARDGATAVLVRDVTAGLEIVSTDGDTVRAGGWACMAGAEIRLARKDKVVVVTVNMPRELEGLHVELAVPRSLTEVAVEGHTGPVRVDDVPARIAVVHTTGPVGVQDVGALRVLDLTGPLEVGNVEGDLILDQLVGPVIARDVRGEVTQNDVTGPISVN